MNDVFVLDNICKSYKGAGNTVAVLKDASLTLQKGELMALLGPSGTGKSTLLHIAGLLDTADSGSIHILGKNYAHASDAERTQARRQHIGFVYQFHHLMPELTALENVILPQRLAEVPPTKAQTRAQELLVRLGLAHRITHLPAALSGGEQQRVAIARALANNPELLLADEPTGNLDEKTADTLINDLVHLARTTQLSALIATHNPEFAKRLDRRIHLRDGVLVHRAQDS